MLDADLLRTFVAIVEAGSFAGAGQIVGRTPSAVSMQIKRLEETVGRRLLSRGAHGVSLTADGDVLLVHARQIVEAHGAAFDAMMHERSARSLSIGSPDAHVGPVLAPLLGDLATRFPDTNLRIVVDGSPALRRQLEEGALDLALLTEFQVGDDRGERVHRERGLWACAEACSVLDASPLPLALTLEGSAYRRHAQDLLRRASRPYRIALASNSEPVIRAAILSGRLVGLLPESRMAPGLRELTPAEGFPALPDLAVRLRLGRRVPPAGEWLAEQLVARGRALDLGGAAASLTAHDAG